MFTFQCPEGWTAIASSCYIALLTTTDSRATAITMCQNAGGSLAVITDAAERDALRSLLPLVENWLVYVDGTDEALEGTWKTQTGETIQSVPFQGPPGSVDTFPIGGTDRNCLHMSFNQFVDAFCVSTNGGALCEINL